MGHITPQAVYTLNYSRFSRFISFLIAHLLCWREDSPSLDQSGEFRHLKPLSGGCPQGWHAESLLARSKARLKPPVADAVGSRARQPNPDVCSKKRGVFFSLSRAPGLDPLTIILCRRFQQWSQGKQHWMEQRSRLHQCCSNAKLPCLMKLYFAVRLDEKSKKTTNKQNKTKHTESFGSLKPFAPERSELDLWAVHHTMSSLWPFWLFSEPYSDEYIYMCSKNNSHRMFFVCVFPR